MATAIAGGQGPDLLYYWQNVVWFFELDSLYDLKEFVLDPVIGMPAESFLPAPRPSVNYGGQVIALPVAFGLGAVKYTIRLIEKAGLDASDPPKAWAEFEQWAVRLTKRSGDDTTQWGVTTGHRRLADTGGHVRQRRRREQRHDDRVRALLEPARRRARVAGPTGQRPEGDAHPAWSCLGGVSQMLASEQGFVTETIAMQIGHSGIAGLVATYPNLRAGLFPIPRGPQTGSTVRIGTGYDGIHVMHEAADPERATSWRSGSSRTNRPTSRGSTSVCRSRR